MSAPDRCSRCACGHLTARHVGKSARPCTVNGCDCRSLTKAPQPCCGRCGHPASFRTRRLANGRYACTALGCICLDWESGQAANQRTDVMTVSARVDGKEVQFQFPKPGKGERLRIKSSSSGQIEIFTWIP